MRRFGTRVVHAALVALLVSAAGVAALVAVGPRTGAYRTLTVLSGSMQPAFAAGSVVIVQPTPLDDLTVGDVITYQVPVEDRRVVSHRIIEIDRTDGATTVRTKGDASPAPDPWRTQLGGPDAWRVSAAVPWLGYAIAVMRTPLLSTLLLLAGPFGLAVSFLRDIWRREDDEVVLPSPVALAGPAAPRRGGPGPLLDTLGLTVRAAHQATRWTDDVVTGKRWLRSQARHA